MSALDQMQPLTQRRYDMELIAVWAAIAHKGYPYAKLCLARCQAAVEAGVSE